MAKGFERGSLLRMTQVIREELPGHPAAALTGPNLAKEIMAGQAAASVIATENLAVARALQSVLQRGMFRIYLNGATRTVAEGVGTAAAARELALRYGVEMPVSLEVYRVLTGEIAAADAYRGLIKRQPAGHEREPG